MDLGRSLKPVASEVDIDALKAGLDDMLADKTPLLDEKQRDEVKNSVAKKLQAKQTEERAAKSVAAKDAGEKFLADNGKRDGVKTTASGLQYEVVSAGKGESPKSTDKVTVHYTGTLIDGTKFDSSVDRGQPVTFPLGRPPHTASTGHAAHTPALESSPVARCVARYSLVVQFSAIGGDAADAGPPSATPLSATTRMNTG